MALMDGRRVSMMIPEDMESQLYEIRNRDDFKRLSLSEIIRRLVEMGLASMKNKEGS